MSYHNPSGFGAPPSPVHMRSPVGSAAPSAPAPDSPTYYQPTPSPVANPAMNSPSLAHNGAYPQMQMQPPMQVTIAPAASSSYPQQTRNSYTATTTSSFHSVSKSPTTNYPMATPVAMSPPNVNANANAFYPQVPPTKGDPLVLQGGLAPVTPYTGPRPAPLMPMHSAGGTPVAPPTPSSIVALRFRCKGLKTSDVFSESDPFIVVYHEEAPRMWRELGRTETVVNSANPTFTAVIEFDYFFEEMQRLRLEVFDRDSTSERLNEHDFLGCVELTMAQLMSSNGQSLVLKLQQSTTKYIAGLSGHLVIDAEELSVCADQVSVQFGADKVDNKDGWFGKSDPFLNIYRLKDEFADPKLSTSWLHVWRSAPIMNNLNPLWPKVTLSVRTLCNGNLQRKLKFECMDWEASGRHQFIGNCTMTAGEFVAGEKLSMDLINPERQARKGKRYTNSGVLRILSIECFKVHTFAEFLRGGCEISLIAGIDFTASNGAPSDPNSLHYIGASAYGQMNDYQAAISASGAILEPYDHDKRFPVYGFGGMVNGQVNHCFPLTFDPTCPEVEGVQGIMDVYAKSFAYLTLHGPTYFAPLIRQAGTIAQLFSQPTPNSAQSLKYFVLLIITDGAIMDMDNTIEEIVTASYLPLSIVIVGAGNADFSAMDALDADGKLLRARSGRTAARDIVQFVPFNRYRSNPTRLSKETLAEIPIQLTQHFQARGIKPNPPLQRAGTDILIRNASVAVNRNQSNAAALGGQV